MATSCLNKESAACTNIDTDLHLNHLWVSTVCHARGCTLLLVRCLGQFRLEANARPCVLPTRKTASLLVYLLLHPEAHEREQLVTRFWGDFGEEQARRSLRTALSTLRKALGESALLADRTKVQFNPDFPIWVDAITLGNQCQRFLDQSLIDPTLVDLALYQGDMLAGFYDEWILRKREEVRLCFLRVLGRLAQHWRTQGDYVRTIEIAQRILQLDPAEETAHQHLLFCYTATGDRQTARQQYEDCVHALREELALEPTAETVALYRRSQQARIQAAAASHSNLPLPLASFIGRGHEIAKVKTLLRPDRSNAKHLPARLVTVTGPGGCGKTRLAIEVARELSDYYADGIWWVELAALTEETQVAQAVAKVLDVQQGVQPSLTDVIINNLRTKHLLLVLDNCEHLIAACAELAERLLSHCPEVQILATSREALGVGGETSWLVPSLTLPTTQPTAPAEYLAFEAIQLFIERASAVQRDFALTAVNASAILQICRQLDGIPLAIELAAARVKLMTVEQIAARLTGLMGASFALLTTGGRTVLPRQQTLRATIDWSYALLNEVEQRLLQRLALFTGGWSLEAAEAVGADCTPHSVVELLARLVDKSLVLAEPQGQLIRYRMLETVRQYAYEQLEKSGEVSAVRDRHLAYFCRLAEVAEPEFRGAGQMFWLRRLDADYENLRAALTWGLQHETHSITRFCSGATLATALIFYWKLRGEWGEEYYWLDLAAQRLALGSVGIEPEQYQQLTCLRTNALYGKGIAAWHQQKLDEAQRIFDESAELWRIVGDRTGFYRAQIFQADLCFDKHNQTEEFVLWRECLAYFSEVQDAWGMAEANFYLGYGERRSGNFGTATSYYEACLALIRPVGDQWLLSLAVSHQGMIALEQLDYERARPLIEQRLQLGREFGLKHHIYTSLGFLAVIAYKQGNLRQGMVLVREAITVQRKLGFDISSNLLNHDKLVIAARACMLDRQHERAVKLLAARHVLISIASNDLSLETNKVIEGLLTSLQAQLGTEAFGAVWAIGAVLTPEQVFEEIMAEE